MQTLTDEQMMQLSGGRKMSCGLWWLMWGSVAGAALIGGGPVGLMGAGIALAGALSDESPC